MMMRFSLVLIALAAWTLSTAEQATAQLSQTDAAFYRMRLAAIERSIRTWGTSGAPDAANQIRRLQNEQAVISTKLQTVRSPQPPPPCDPRDPSFCDINRTPR